MSSSEDDIVRQVTAKLAGEFYVGQVLRVNNPLHPWTAIVRVVTNNGKLLLEEVHTNNQRFYDAYSIREVIDHSWAT